MSGFNINVIPADNRTKEQIASHVEIYKRTQDTCIVHNPTEEDYIVYNDKLFSNESWVIPNKNKDVGYNKGNAQVPRFIAMRYLNKMGEKLITKISEEDWKERRKQYRQDEWGDKEERMAIRVNNKDQWDKITPKLFLGVVKRYQEDQLLDEQEPAEQKKQTYSQAEEAMERLNISDKEFGVQDLEERKNDLANQLQ